MCERKTLAVVVVQDGLAVADVALRAFLLLAAWVSTATLPETLLSLLGDLDARKTFTPGRSTRTGIRRGTPGLLLGTPFT